MKWLSERDLAAPGVRLFCLPHAGSGSAGFYRWKRLLSPQIAVCPVMLPGREARLSEPPLQRVMDMVGQLHAEARTALDRPYVIFGHSMGSLLAYEWARQIAADDLRLPEALFVSGRNAPQWPSGHSGLHALDDEALVLALRDRYGGAPDVLLDDAELREIFLPILRADLAAVETYQHVPGLALRHPVVAIAGDVDRSVSDAGLNAWKDTAARQFEAKRITGDHFYPFEARHFDAEEAGGQDALLKLIAEHLPFA
jgi:surfactin synthase thioesterase subunit